MHWLPFIESLVNSPLGKRFTKKQQMQWPHGGAHLLLRTRGKTIISDLAAMFHRWFPALGPRQLTGHPVQVTVENRDQLPVAFVQLASAQPHWLSHRQELTESATVVAAL